MIHDPVIVRLSVESMKHQILHAFTEHQFEMNSIVAEALKGAIDEDKFAAEIKNEAVRLFRDEIKKQVQSAVWRVMWNDEAKAVIEHGVREGIRIALADPPSR